MPHARQGGQGAAPSPPAGGRGTSGGGAIGAYDLRYILSSATAAEKAVAASWTLHEGVWSLGDGSLQHELTGLVEHTGDDIQVRAVSGAGDGAWSATREAATGDHRDPEFFPPSNAGTPIALGSSVTGTLSSVRVRRRR